VSFLQASPDVLLDFPVSGHGSIAVYLKLIIPDMLPSGIDRVLFIDSDAVVTQPLDDLWRTNLNGKALAAVPEHKLCCLDHGYSHGDYFNSGVMLIDLARWRKTDIIGKGLEFAKNNPDRLRHWDQDVLNHVFKDDWLTIGQRWNACPYLFGLMPKYSLADEDLTASEKEAINDPAIVHFAGPGPVKPWNARCRHPLRHHYLRARSQMPWADQPLDDAPPPRLQRLWGEAMFRTKSSVKRLIESLVS
jgi:lipopolysaccharide biosynthesis glycosyltransferase